jgi:hypothetical protein
MLKKINKNHIYTGIIIILIIVLLGVVFWSKIVKDSDKSEYSVIYLTSGEVYIGKLKTFPRLVLIDSYLYQVTKDQADPSKNNFQLNPIKDALWAPEKMIIKRQNVLFYGPLLKTSKIAETLTTQQK